MYRPNTHTHIYTWNKNASLITIILMSTIVMMMATTKAITICPYIDPNTHRYAKKCNPLVTIDDDYDIDGGNNNNYNSKQQ